MPPLRTSLALLVIGLAANPLQAQTLRGRVVSLRTGRPVAEALAVLLDSSGAERARTGTVAGGRFAFRVPAPGRYTVRVLRIGFAPWTSQSVALPPGSSRDVDLALPDERLVLPEMVVSGASSCGEPGGSAQAAAFLLEEARKAYTLAEVAIEDGRLSFRTSTYLHELDADLVIQRELFRATTDMRTWPIESAPVDSLARWGFVKAATESEAAIGFGPKYFGPDGRVLFSSWFLSAHCFEIVAAPDRADSLTVGLRFRVADRVTRPDIEGTLWLDSSTFELHRLDYHYVNLARWVPAERTGGFLEFDRLPAGGWIIRRWRLRAPIPEVGPTRTRLAGYQESGGVVE